MQYRDGVKWWLTEKETALAEEEQDERYVEDAWLQCISRYVGASAEIAIDDVLSPGIEKPKERWSALDMSRVSGRLRRLGFKKKRVGSDGNRRYRYVREPLRPVLGGTLRPSGGVPLSPCYGYLIPHVLLRPTDFGVYVEVQVFWRFHTSYWF